MGTKANIFVDVLAICTSYRAFEAAAKTTGWNWHGAEGEWLRGNSIIQQGTLLLMRVLTSDYEALLANATIMATLSIFETADPYATRPEEEAGLNDVFYKAKSNPATVLAIRTEWPTKSEIQDSKGDKLGDIEKGIRFASFGDYAIDVAGDNETTVTPGKITEVTKVAEPKL